MKTYDTEARRALCEFMKNNAERQFTAEELCAAVSHSAGKSTVYRLIARLCDEGEIRRIPRGGERGAYYQAMTGEPCLRHLHLKCLSCGLLIHLDENESRRIASVALGRNFTVDGKKTMLFGYCGLCADGAGKESV